MERVSSKRDFSISVAIATYNGEKYIKEQLDSILKQLNESDEIIISDDGSTDNTISIIKGYGDNRIKIVKGPKQGFAKNFENCISHCTGKYIFISDQDDIWENDKVKKVLDYFQNNKCTCVVHDATIVDENKNIISSKSVLDSKKFKRPGIISNIIQGKYYGCLMAFDSVLIDRLLPIPEKVDHDMWIGLISDKYGKTLMVNDKLIKYRRHNSNTSSWGKHMGIVGMIKKRIRLIKNIIKR